MYEGKTGSDTHTKNANQIRLEMDNGICTAPPQKCFRFEWQRPFDVFSFSTAFRFVGRQTAADIFFG